MKTIETTIKKAESKTKKMVELITFNHNVFGDVYYIYVDGDLQHSQYGTRKLDAIFNEFVSEEFDIVYAY